MMNDERYPFELYRSGCDCYNVLQNHPNDQNAPLTKHFSQPNNPPGWLEGLYKQDGLSF